MTFFLTAYLLAALLPHAAKAKSHAPTGDLVLLDEYKTATCLDGSPGAYYIAESTSGSSNWVISLEGGGECVDLDSCSDRANTKYGSSNSYASTLQLEHTIQSTAATANPGFYDWNMVYVKYCSGDLHMGQQDPAKDESTVGGGMYFSGHNILAATIDSLTKNYNLTDSHSSTILWSGESAGGMGCFNSLDFVYDTFESALVVGVPVGGFYFSNEWVYGGTDENPAIDYIPWAFKDLKDYLNLWEAYVPSRCAVARPDAPHECLIAEGLYDSLAAPVFVVEAQTDEVVMPLHDGLPSVWAEAPYPCYNEVETCPQEILDYMLLWQRNMTSFLSPLVSNDVPKKGNLLDGLFNPACLIHTSFSNTQPLIDSMHYAEAAAKWLENPGDAKDKHLHFDECEGDTVMCNPTCETK
ncbi:hypothetical protein TrST_g11910 [Triparma strigata]|uniref:Pectin acetylesterase n=1 Tax=Triparma strigata TaxID=1606541 RepID=A0A9W6ZMI0_9STRA|nr:hypothetical protein TrST_g11910 [Triparma strigata]